MARARLQMTGKSHKRPQPVCNKCGEVIEPGTMRYTWSFRYGGTFNRHETCGAPRASELTQGRVGELYAAQEAVEDVLAEDNKDFDFWKSNVGEALNSAAETARELGEEYREAAEHFGGEGENAERADSCEEWADTCESAASEVEGVEKSDAENDPANEFDATEDDAHTDAVGEVQQAAEDAIQSLSL